MLDHPGSSLQAPRTRRSVPPCPYSHHTSSSSPSGSSSRLRSPKGRWDTPWAATAPAYPTEWSSRSWFRSLGVRLRLSEDRRGGVLGHHAARATRRVDRTRSDGEAAGNGARGLRSIHRPRSGRRGGRRLLHHHEGPLRGGEKAGKSPVDRGKRGTKRSTAVDARGIPLGTVTAPANRHDSPLLPETLDAVAETLGVLPEGASIHLATAATTRGAPASGWESVG